MKRLLYFLLFTALGFGNFLPAISGQQLDTFVEKARLFDRILKPIDHIDSPFLPYLNRLFEEGLGGLERLEFEKAQNSGDIVAVSQMMETGFRRLYPFLEPAFENPDTYRITGYFFSSPDLPGNKLATINSQLTKLFSRQPRESFKPVNVSFSITLKYALRQYQQMPPGEDYLSTVLFGLGVLAFCDDYPPAIAKLLLTLNQSGGMILREADQIFLMTRAGLHGLHGLKLDRMSGELAASMDENRFSKLQKSARTAHITQMQSHFGYWPGACLEVEKMRWNETHK